MGLAVGEFMTLTNAATKHPKHPMHPMHTLIVCGTPWCQLDSIFAQLQAAGLAAALPAPAGHIPTVDSWHTQLFAQTPATGQAVQPGKAWERAAGDLFAANWARPLWGWADHRSTWLLKFWRNFDRQTRFVLVHTPAADALVVAAQQANAADFDAVQVLDTWCAHQAHMLKFHQRHPKRCVWVSHHHFAAGQPLGNALPLEWSLQLQGSGASGGSITLVSPETDQPHNEPTDHTTALLQSLAAEAVRRHPQAAALQSEVWAALPRAGKHAPALPAPLARPKPRDALMHARHVVLAQTQAGQNSEQLGQQIKALNAHLAAEYQAKAAHANAAAEQKLKQQAEQTKALEAHLAQKSRAHTDAQQEAELLLLQLHQVQEELERYFLQHQEVQQANQKLQTRLTQWAQRHPDHVEWDSLAVLPHTQASKQEVLLTGVQHGGREIAQLHLQLHHTKKQTRLVLLHQAGQPAPLLRWPQQASEPGTQSPATELVLELPAKPVTAQSTALAQLAPSDLHMLMAMCKAVGTHLAASTPSQSAWAAHWQAAAKALSQLPPTWRYDALSLRNEQVNPDYEHLWFRLENTQYGTRQWPVFEFRLSASNVRKGKWSHLPKLEFPLPDDNGPKQFENWFEESEDDKGPKFELRFDMKTPAMDMNSWHALGQEDKAQAIALVHQLKGLLGELEQSGSLIKRPWADWYALAGGIQHALHSVCTDYMVAS
jgi:hypothetical protein